MKKNIIRIVKMAAFYTFLGLILQGILVNILLASSPTEGQNLRDVKISARLNNISLEQAFEQIEKSSNFKFFYVKEEIPLNEKVSINVEDESLFDILEGLAKEFNLVFNRINNQIVVKKAKRGEKEIPFNIAETFTIKGKVTDARTGEPLIGANVFIKEFGMGAATNNEGNYSVEIPKERAQGQQVDLTVSYIGYKPKSVKILLTGYSIQNDFTLDEDIFQSEEVVVTGIASKTSKAVAEVAVARINAAELTGKQSYTSFAQLVSGKVAGVNMQIASGNVGSGFRFFVRGGGGLTGDGQPVIYIDGVRIDNSEFELGWTGGQTASSLSNLNPNDIENIEILKGPAAAAMYGTGGSNGVVLITTKQAKVVAQGVTNIEYAFTYGTNQMYYKYDESLYLNAPFYNKLMEPPGYTRENQVSVAGGTNLFRYFTSFTNRYEEGLLGWSNHMDRSSLRANISAVPHENLSIKVSTGFTWNKLRQPQMDNNTYSWNSNAFTYQRRWNGADSASIAAYETWNDSKEFIGSAQIVWKPITNLEINGGSGLESSTWDGIDYRPFGYKYGGLTTGSKELYHRFLNQFTYDLNARYFLNLFDVNLTSIVGTQILERRLLSNYSGGRYFPNPIIQEIQAAGEKFDAEESKSHSREAGIYWTNEFSYDNTYFWTLAIRRDYASVIGVDAPAITYPKASFALRADKFGILPSDISMLKLRVAYGETGQLPRLDDAIPITWGTSTGTGGLIGYTVQSKGNSAIQPERIKEWEFGFDIEFLKIFSLEFTHYRQNATNLIVNSTISPSTGLYQYPYPVNVGSIKSSGFEALLQINPIRSADYDLNISLIWNYQTNEVIDLGETEEIAIGAQVIRPGLPKYEFYTYVAVSPKFDPVSKKYIGINLSGERVDLGNPIPDHSGSFSINFRFLKNFNLYASGEWALNNKIYSSSLNRFWNYNTHIPQRLLAIKLGYHNYGSGQFLPVPEDAGITPLTPGTPEYIAAAWEYIQYERTPANYVKDASYFVLRELSLSYNFTELLNEFLPNSYVKTLNLGIAVRNVFRISNYDLGFENSHDGGRGSGLSEDYNTLPPTRNITFWAKFGF